MDSNIKLDGFPVLCYGYCGKTGVSKTCKQCPIYSRKKYARNYDVSYRLEGLFKDGECIIKGILKI